MDRSIDLAVQHKDQQTNRPRPNRDLNIMMSWKSCDVLKYCFPKDLQKKKNIARGTTDPGY